MTTTQKQAMADTALARWQRSRHALSLAGNLTTDSEDHWPETPDRDDD